MKRRPPSPPGRFRWFLPLLLLLVSSPPAGAKLCTPDQVPSATLLVPYFELDLAPGATDDVIVTLNNADAEAALVHATFWTDWAQPTVSFEIYLTGYDVLTFGLRQAFNQGNLPITADLQSDPGDTISPSPDLTQETSFPGCAAIFPTYINPILNAARLERLRDGHTGQPISALANGCLGASHGDQVARGFITFDSVNRCSLGFPTDTGGDLPYFVEGGLGIASNRNSIWGDYLIHKPAEAQLLPMTMAHIEAADGLSNPTGYTFYGGFTGAAGSDDREPLGSVWAVPGILSGTGEMVVWRDPTAAPATPGSGFGCGIGPDWAPLAQDRVHCFDEEENFAEVCFDRDCFPLATQRTVLEAGGIETPFPRGFCVLNLGLSREGSVNADIDFAGGIAQSFVTSMVHYEGLASVGLPSMMLRSACETATPSFLEINLFRDGFESGNTSAWSQVVP